MLFFNAAQIDLFGMWILIDMFVMRASERAWKAHYADIIHEFATLLLVAV